MITFKLKKYEERFKVLFYLEAAHHYDMAFLYSVLSKEDFSWENAEKISHFTNLDYRDKNYPIATSEEFMKKSSDYVDRSIDEYINYKKHRDCGYISKRAMESFYYWYTKDLESFRIRCCDSIIRNAGQLLLSLHQDNITKEQLSIYMLLLNTENENPIRLDKKTIIMQYLKVKEKIKEIEDKISKRTSAYH